MTIIVYDETGQLYKVPDGDSAPEVSITVPDDATVNGGNIEYIYDETADDVTTSIPPSPDRAYQEINQYFINQEGSTNAGLDRVDQLMSSYPSADRALANKNYDLFKNRISKAQNDGMLTSQETSDLTDIVDGK